MFPSTPQATSPVAATTSNQRSLGYVTNPVPSVAPQQFNIPTMVRQGSHGGIVADTTSPYLGVFNR